MTAALPAWADALAAALGARDVRGLRRLSGGASRDTWAFDADGRPLILQRARPGGVASGPMATEVALLRAAVRAEHGESAAQELSSYAVALDIAQMHRGMMVALPAVHWAEFGDMAAAELAAALRQMARSIDLKRYRKTTRGPKKPKTRKLYKGGGHVSTHRLLQQRNE